MTKIKNVLISQPEPANIAKSPYKNLVEKFNLDLTFYKFFEVIGVEAKEFRKERIHLTDYSAVIFNSKNSVDHFFRLAKEVRADIPDTMKYFCASEAIALYLQTYVQYRKRKIFFGKQTFADLIDVMHKHKSEKFLLPCSDEPNQESFKLLDKSKYNYTKASMYKSVPRNLNHIKIEDYDMIVLFSPIGVKSLMLSFPDFKKMDDKVVAAFGLSTHAALAEAGITLNIAAPTKAAPSMAMAIEDFMMGKEPEPVIISKPVTLKKPVPKKPVVKKTKSVFVNKSKYDALMKEKKEKAAAKRAEAAQKREEKSLQ